MDTSAQYDRIIGHCQQLFEKKTTDYGTAWRIMRLPSITDQLYIKAQRVRTLEEKGVSKVGDGVQEEYIGIVNYCVIAIIQLALADNRNENLPLPEVVEKYNQVIAETKELMFAKNHDYGEAWRDMRLTSLTDLILMKIYRVKQIENNEGLTVASEGVKANYQDMLNYAVFALIKLGLAAG
ncbi:DUF1599 domain-containing protein [Parapedobacter sp. GCM10030251]|uniref:DUF1599 domain-containing protein n=1 Tax=Parapedobacter sp. GCM10030251 TaxID=3273419 RepID=UPI0036138FCF